MDNLAQDSSKDIALFINDFYDQYIGAVEKLSEKLGREIHGVILLDKSVKERNHFMPDKDHVFEEIICDFENDSELRATVKKLEDRLLLVSAVSEWGQPYFAKVVPHVPWLLAPTESSLEWATHKAKMRELLQGYDPNLAPKVQPIFDAGEAEIAKVLTNLSFPMIVKPSGLAASILVSKVHNEEELVEKAVEAFKVINDIYVRDGGRGKPSLLIEEFMEGNMYSVDAYINNSGKVWTLPVVKVTTAASIGQEGYYSYRNDTHHDLNPEEAEAAQKTAAKAMRAICLRSCVSHVELFKTPTGWKIIELGSRPGGYRQDMYFYGYGINHAYNELLIKAGLEPEINTKPIAYSAIFNMYADEEGTIEGFDGLEEAKKLASIKKFDVHKDVGDMALYCGNGGRLIIDGVLSNESFDALNKDMDSIRANVKIRVKKA